MESKLKQYTTKQKRVRDPNAPPAPNLFSTVKELKDTKATIQLAMDQISRLEARITKLEAKNNQLENAIETLKSKLYRR